MPVAEPATRQNPETPVRILKARPRLAALQDQQLLPEAVRSAALLVGQPQQAPTANIEASPLPLLLNRQEADVVQCRQWE